MPRETVQTFWNDRPLRSAVGEGYVVSVKAAEQEAEALNPAPSHIHIVSTASEGGQGQIRASGDIAKVMEEGRRGGYEIAPKNKTALAGPNFGPVAVVRGGSMAAQPYLRPTAAAWASGIYHRISGAVLRARGFYPR